MTYGPYDARHRGGPPGECFIRHDPPRPAAYRWTAQPSGNEIDVCEECTAAWRLNAARWPDLAPARIVSLARAQ